MDKTTPTSTLARALFVAGLAAASASSLTACVPLVAVGAASASMMVLSDRRTIGTQTADEQIELKAAGNLNAQIKESGGIGIVCFNRKVLLYGQVPDADTKHRAEQVVGAILDVKSVQNELQVAGRANITTRASDVGLTTKIRASFFDARDMQSSIYKVVTEAGVVYLMGIVTRKEGDRAASVAAGVTGVRKVVTVFDYVTDEELAHLLSDREREESKRQPK